MVTEKTVKTIISAITAAIMLLTGCAKQEEQIMTDSTFTTNHTTEIVTEKTTDITGEAVSPIVEIEEENEKWVTAWAAAPLKVDKSTAKLFAENTMRQSARITLGGDKFTFTFSNEYCTTPLDIDTVYISKQIEVGKNNIDENTTVKLTFNGSENVTVAAGETITSDPVDFSCAALENIAVSIEFGENVPEMMTGHDFAASTCWFAEGKVGTSADLGKFRSFDYRYCLAKINVWNTTGAGAVICFGDSITDGVGSIVDNYNNYPDLLANLMQSDDATSNYSVVNSGIGGNKLADSSCAGTMGLIRFERDILNIEGAKYAIIFIGTNDVGGSSDSTVDKMLTAYKTLVDECHKNGITVYAATITPLKKSGYDSDFNRQILNELNAYLMSDESVFDGVIDFYSAVEDPNNPETVADEYNCMWGDYLHLGPKGYEKLAQTAYEFLKKEIEK